MRKLQSNILKYGENVDISKENRKNLKKKIITSDSSDEQEENSQKVHLINNF